MAHKRNGEIVTPKDEWSTPPALFKLLDDEFHFDIDAAATEQNALARKCFTKERNGLVHGWGAGNVFLNPPYSQGNIEHFMIKAHIEGCLREPGTYVVCLIPVASDTKWWHHSVMLAKEIRFIKGIVSKSIRKNEMDEIIDIKPFKIIPMQQIGGFKLLTPIYLEITYDKSKNLWKLFNKEISVYGSGITVDQAKESFVDAFERLIVGILAFNEEKLSDKSKEIKHLLEKYLNFNDYLSIMDSISSEE